MVYRYLLEEMYLLHINMQNNKYLPVKYKIQYKKNGNLLHLQADQWPSMKK